MENREGAGLNFWCTFLSMIFLNLLLGRTAIAQEPVSSPVVMQQEHGLLPHARPLELSPDAVRFFSPDIPSPPEESFHQDQPYSAASSSSGTLHGIKSSGDGISQGAKAAIGVSVLLVVVFAGAKLYVYATRRTANKKGQCNTSKSLIGF
ncbi:hypothetical protein SUGI_1127700 [Cryptomeria japonica]|nr:hypothetical protein SUGI_1127700 [Cryptomeria japonica]